MAGSRRSPVSRIAVGALVLFALAVLLSLGVWQVERRTWKLDLIAHVNERIHEPAATAPPPADWPAINAAADAYRHIQAQGTYLDDETIYVHATTTYGMGYWVMTPLRTDKGFTVIVNRGFVPAEFRLKAKPAAGGIATGLLRVSEPGNWLRANDPAQDNWYSRDVAAMAQKRGLQQAAPYFIDADATADAKAEGKEPAMPIGGLTIIDFPNNHFIYACTWFGLALLLAFGAGKALRST
ncbi:MAG: SURF1 family protein [Micavibrio sp.]|nr:SURF1 family protein [Micavibrio sp.]